MNRSLAAFGIVMVVLGSILLFRKAKAKAETEPQPPASEPPIPEPPIPDEEQPPAPSPPSNIPTGGGPFTYVNETETIGPSSWLTTIDVVNYSCDIENRSGNTATQTVALYWRRWFSAATNPGWTGPDGWQTWLKMREKTISINVGGVYQFQDSSIIVAIDYFRIQIKLVDSDGNGSPGLELEVN